MKRIIAILLLSVLLICLSVPAFATQEENTAVDPKEDQSITAYLSDDLMSVNIQDKTYVRFNASALTSDGDYFWDSGTDNDSLVIPESQKQSIEYADFSVYNTDVALRVYLDYTDGVHMEICYIRQDLYEQYQQMLTSDAVTVEFHWPEDNSVDLKLDYQTMEKTILFTEDLYDTGGYFQVIAQSSELRVSRGLLLTKGDDYYYFDYEENGTDYVNHSSEAIVWQITDPATCTALDEAMDAYYESDLGFFENDDFSLALSKVFLIIVFVVFPAIVLVLFLILAIRAKTPVYKKLFWNLCAWSGVLLIFVGMVAAFVNFSG